MAYIPRYYPYMKKLVYETLTTPLQTKYDRLLLKIRDGILQSKLKFQKFKMREVPWIRILQEIMDTILIFRVVLSRKKGSRVSTRYINILEIWVNIQNSLYPSIVQVENYLTNSYCRYYEFKDDSLNQIKSWLSYLTALKAKENGGGLICHMQEHHGPGEATDSRATHPSRNGGGPNRPHTCRSEYHHLNQK